MKPFRNTLIALGVFFAAASIVLAGSITTWSSGDVLTSNALNANFQHIHNTMVGGHGARLVDADVASNAGISHSKLATPALLPRAWGSSFSECSATPCTLTVSSGITSVVRNSTGSYTVTLSTARPDSTFTYSALAFGASAHRLVKLGTPGNTTQFTFLCYSDLSYATPADCAFQFTVYDNN